jgi:hypothetical protein
MEDEEMLQAAGGAVSISMFNILTDWESQGPIMAGDGPSLNGPGSKSQDRRLVSRESCGPFRPSRTGGIFLVMIRLSSNTGKTF